MYGSDITPRPLDAVDDAVLLCRDYARQPFVDEEERREHLAAAAVLAALRGPERASRAKRLAVMLSA